MFSNRCKEQLLPNHRGVLLLAFHPPSASVTKVRILPEWRSLFSHEVIVRAVGKLMKAGDMIENGPKSLDSGHRVYFL